MQGSSGNDVLETTAGSNISFEFSRALWTPRSGLTG
jgi:hypothetical protein